MVRVCEWVRESVNVTRLCVDAWVRSCIKYRRQRREGTRKRASEITKIHVVVFREARAKSNRSLRISGFFRVMRVIGGETSAIYILRCANS